MQIEKDAKAFRGQMMKLQEKAKEKEERALRLGEALKLGLSQMQLLEDELRRHGVDPRSIVPHPVRFPGTRKDADTPPITNTNTNTNTNTMASLDPSDATMTDTTSAFLDPIDAPISLPPITTLASSLAASPSPPPPQPQPQPQPRELAPLPLPPALAALPPSLLEYSPSPRAQRFHMPRPPPPPVALDVPPPDNPTLNAAYGVPELPHTAPHTPHTPHTPRTPLGPIQRGAPATPRAKERLPGYTRKPPYNSKFSAPYPAEG
eukprot:TRINITY_DN1341_c0_g1_i3.p1 TRINITY_DN1341_c0_g1~~TRINITY_DN1341_c0_g1_i3.p1  ORF type:complete len:263 (+),score=60.98 TRINITY_DN1341_c0_g1_i3:222-1010(+)